MSLEIVEMERKYLEAARDLYQYYVANTTVTYQIHEATLADMESLLFFDTPKYRSFAALEDGAFIGYGIITRYKSREAFDNTAEITIYLAQSATGKRYGRIVVDHLESFARSQNIHVLESLISGDNVASVKLFERCGYAKCAHHHEVGFKFGRWLDLVCHEKIL
jgi:Sortase and related acyltransferases